jgi:hypothetical protein
MSQTYCVIRKLASDYNDEYNYENILGAIADVFSELSSSQYFIEKALV